MRGLEQPYPNTSRRLFESWFSVPASGFPQQVLPSLQSQFHHVSGRFGAMPAPFAAVRPCQELYLAVLHLKVTLFVFSLWHVAPCHAYWGNCTRPSLTLGVFVQKSLAMVHSHLLLWVSRGSPSLPNPAGSGPRGELLRNVSWKRSVPSAGGRAALVEAVKSRSFQQCSEKCDICPYWHFSIN